MPELWQAKLAVLQLLKKGPEPYARVHAEFRKRPEVFDFDQLVRVMIDEKLIDYSTRSSLQASELRMRPRGQKFLDEFGASGE